MDPEIAAATQASLGKTVQTPQLTTKLLSRPPFRFLRDVLVEVVRSTGFLDGLFTEEELTGDVKDKAAKLAFLQRAIDATSLCVGQPLPANPSKIVAGKEPENTNAWLQAIGAAVDAGVRAAGAAPLAPPALLLTVPRADGLVGGGGAGDGQAAARQGRAGRGRPPRPRATTRGADPQG